VFQDNKTDWFSSFNPASGERIDIFNMVETGYGFGQHMGRLSNPAKKGWLMISSYTVEDEGWADNQILIVEIKPHTQHPRIWRVSPTFNRRWVGGVDEGGAISPRRSPASTTRETTSTSAPIGWGAITWNSTASNCRRIGTANSPRRNRSP